MKEMVDLMAGLQKFTVLIILVGESCIISQNFPSYLVRIVNLCLIFSRPDAFFIVMAQDAYRNYINDAKHVSE